MHTVCQDRNEGITRGLETLDTANVASKGAEACPRSDIPQLDGRVIAGREKQRLLVNLDLVDQIRVSLEGRTLARGKVPRLDGRISRARRQDARVKVKCNDTICVALKRTDALTSVVVPDLEGTIHGSSDQFGLIKMERSYAQSMSLQCTKAFARFDIPHLGGVVVGSSNEERVVKLQAHHSVSVTTELFQTVIALSPVSLYD